MSDYLIREVSGREHRDTILSFNAMDSAFPALEDRHFDGYWFFAYWHEIPVAFACIVPFTPFPRSGHLKRVLVLRDHRGNGLQQKLMYHCELRAIDLGWTCLVAEVAENNPHSNLNFEQCEYEQTIPEQPWSKDCFYWIKHL